MRKWLIVVILAVEISMVSFPCLAGEIKPKYGPVGAPRAVSLALSHEYFQSKQGRSPDFWSLIGYYVPQFNGAACSVASVAMVLNAARAGMARSADDKVVSQADLLDKVDVEHWKQRVSSDGFNGQHGLTLDPLGRVVEATFKAYGFAGASVKVVHIFDTSAKTKAELIKALRENEKSASNFMIANFNQRIYTDDAEAGHIAPVGAFDESNQRVLILDPDREYYEPYWVSVDTFMEGMVVSDKLAKANRGYVLVQLPQRP